MNRVCVAAMMMVGLAAAAPAELLQDNYLGNPNEVAWTLPYDGVAGQSSERYTIVTDSWAGDDLVIPDGWQYVVQKINWIGLLLDGPGAEWDYVDVVIYERNPDGLGHPISPGDAPVAEFNNLAVDSFAQRIGGGGTPETLYGLDVYEGSITIPDVALDSGHYYYAVRMVGNGRGQHFIATTGGGVDFGAGEMGVMQSEFFFEHDWVDIVDVLEVPVDPNDPNSPTDFYATDFAYQVWGQAITPEPTSALLLLLGGLVFGWRR